MFQEAPQSQAATHWDTRAGKIPDVTALSREGALNPLLAQQQQAADAWLHLLAVGHCCPPPCPSPYSLAEVEEEALKDQHGPGAAQNGEGLASQEAEHGARHRGAQEALQHALRGHGTGVTLSQGQLLA